jgi:hypothetical protein
LFFFSSEPPPPPPSPSFAAQPLTLFFSLPSFVEVEVEVVDVELLILEVVEETL